MIPAAFEYQRAESIDHAIALLRQHEGEAKLLAGGHSLLPLMKLRLAQPAMLVDLGAVGELSYVRRDGDQLAIGPMTTHHMLETSDLVRRSAPLLAEAAATVGDMQVRNRGTIGGTLAHSDPAGDLPAVAVVLGASLRIRGSSGERTIQSEEFFQDIWTTALEPDEVITEIHVPVAKPGDLSSYEKFRQRAGDWATVGVAMRLRRVDGNASTASIVLVNVGPTPVRAVRAEKLLSEQSPSPDLMKQAADAVAEDITPTGDLKASADYKRRLVRVLTRRVLEKLLLPGTSEHGL